MVPTWSCSQQWILSNWMMISRKRRCCWGFQVFFGRHIYGALLWTPKLVALRYDLWDVVSPVNTPTSLSPYLVFCFSTHPPEQLLVARVSLGSLGRADRLGVCSLSNGKKAPEHELRRFSRPLPLKNSLDIFCHGDKAVKAFIVQKRWMQNQFRGRVRVLQEKHLDL